jgi:hypothetical protein
MSQNGKKIESEVVGEKSDETESESKAVEGNMVDTQEYLTGIRLTVLVAITTAVAFLVFLDSSILVTVSSWGFPSFQCPVGIMGIISKTAEQAIPQITTQFHSIDDIGWYGSAYLLAK